MSSFHAPEDAPRVLADAGEHAPRLTLEFLFARITNAHIREAYGTSCSFLRVGAGARRALAGSFAPMLAAHIREPSPSSMYRVCTVTGRRPVRRQQY
jgi:hypothetical protein